MDTEQIFGVAIGIKEPWFIEKIEMVNQSELHIYVGLRVGTRFEFDGQDYGKYDYQERTWRHLNFFQHECYIHCKVPRIQTKSGSTKLVEVPWAAPGSSFTLLFSAYSQLLVKQGLSFAKTAEYVNVSGKQVSKMVYDNVNSALDTQKIETVQHLGVDETSIKKGHQYITVLTDTERKKVVAITTGKDSKAMQEALDIMDNRGAKPHKIRTVTMDMSPAYISTAEDWLPNASMVFDRFHLEVLANKKVDEIRKYEAKQYKELKNTKYLWLRNNHGLKEEQKLQIQLLEASFPTLGKAYRLKEQLKTVMNEAYYSKSLKGIKTWMKLAQNSQILQMQQLAKTFERHWIGIKNYFRTHRTNAFAERVNLKIQEIKRIARGFANIENFKAMIFFHLGGLELNLPKLPTK
jgi:transposase